MMELSLTEWVLTILVGSMVLVLVFAMISRAARIGVEARSASRRTRCRLCLHVFEDGPSQGAVACPQCGAANEKGCRGGLG